MKRMFSVIASILKRERGFTLIEMVTVVAIMGVMAAVAVPMVNTQLGKSREQSYNQDQALIQTAVDSFFAAADNVRYQGQRQFPILGANSGEDIVGIHTGTAAGGNGVNRKDETVNAWVDGEGGTSLSTPLNPLRGTQGGEPRWIDGPVSLADNNRSGEDNLNGESQAIANTGSSGWYVAKVPDPVTGDDFAVDSRDYFIDFRKLVTTGLLQKVPESASLDNGGGGAEGSYSWYLKSTGVVDSLFFHFPENGTDFDGTVSTTTEDQRGFFDGVYP